MYEIVKIPLPFFILAGRLTTRYLREKDLGEIPCRILGIGVGAAIPVICAFSITTLGLTTSGLIPSIALYALPYLAGILSPKKINGENINSASSLFFQTCFPISMSRAVITGAIQNGGSELVIHTNKKIDFMRDIAQTSKTVESFEYKCEKYDLFTVRGDEKLPGYLWYISQKTKQRQLLNAVLKPV